MIEKYILIISQKNISELEKVFVDTNIILDWLGKRVPFFVAAQKLFKKGEDKKIRANAKLFL